MFYTLLPILFTISVVLQIGYLLFINLGFNKVNGTKNTILDPLSIIICAKNELSNLQILLPELLQQTHPNFEMVIVNDRSTDGTREFLEKKKKDSTKLNVVHIQTTPAHINPKKYAITLGVKAAHNEKLIFTDADCRPNSNDWLTHISGAFDERTDIVLGYSGYEKMKGFLNYFIRFETLWTGMQYIAFAALGYPYMGVGRNMGYKKGLFLKSKGFNGYQELTGGDDDLFIQKNANSGNTAIAIGSENLVWSKPKTTFKAYYFQKLRHLSIGKYYSFKSKIILSIWSFSHLLFWALFVCLAILKIELYLLAGSFFLRTFIFYFTFKRSYRKLGERFELWGLMALDCIFVVYYTSVGIMALFTKRVKWI
ncbi:MAG: glycosyltransferase [Bacteroidota bacterium]